MFEKKRSEESFENLQKLLATKRMELPPQSYFDGVLHEFHDRQRAMLFEPRYTVVTRLFAWLESVREAFAPRPVLRYATATAAVAILLAIGLKVSWNDTDSGVAPSLALQQQAPNSSEHFAFSQALEPQKVSNVDQQIDAASVGPVSLDNKPVMPHYVIAQAPTSYDTAMAF